MQRGRGGYIYQLFVAVMLLLFGVVTFIPLRAQTPQDILTQGNTADNQIGSNPFFEEGGDEFYEDDSVKVKKKNPLESYFFDDSIRALPNFMWNITSGFNSVDIMPLDTALTDWRIDYPFLKDGVGDMYLGGLGQASQSINYFTRADYFDFSYAQAFDAYIYDMETFPFVNAKKPFTQFTYMESGSQSYREVNFGITHSQNINPSTGFIVDFKSRGTEGLYDRQDALNENLAIGFYHTGKQYTVHAGYVNNRIETEENGGVVGVWAVRDTVFDNNIGVPMKLATAEASNEYKNHSFFVQQSYGVPLLPLTQRDFSLGDLPAIYFGHSFEYSSWSKTYRDIRSSYTNERAYIEDGEYVSVVDEYYANWFINSDTTLDSLRERKISNSIFVQAQPWDRDGIVGTLNGGVGMDNYLYSQMDGDSYLTGQYSKEYLTAWYGYASIEGKVRKYADWGANFKYYPSGYRAGDTSIGADIALKAYIRNKPLILSGSFTLDSSTPSYWEQNLFSNHFMWFTPLEKETESRLELKFEVPDYALEIAAWQGVVTNKVYYDAESEIAQSSEAVSLSSLYARKDFRIGGLHLDNRVLMQWSSNQVVEPLPLVSVNLSYYYEFWVVENVLRLQIGFDGRYTSAYYMPGYNPALSTFYNQREWEIGEYPYVDVFLAGKWKTVRIILKYQHANQDLFGNGEYFTVAGYPQNPAMFKFGFSWGFYD